MLKRLRSWFVMMYIYFSGVRFYSTSMIPENKDLCKFTAKTIYGYAITFTFHKENLCFTQYVFGKLRRRKSCVYLVTASFDDSAPETIKFYNNIRIYMNDSWFFLSDEDTVMRMLLNVYIDYIYMTLKKA